MDGKARQLKSRKPGNLGLDPKKRLSIRGIGRLLMKYPASVFSPFISSIALNQSESQKPRRLDKNSSIVSKSARILGRDGKSFGG
jgi:hypothetical protein